MKKPFRFRLSCILFMTAFLLSGCSMKKTATTTIGRIARDGVIILESERDLDLARDSTPSLILTLEVFSRGNPKDKRLLTLLAQAYGQYSFGFLEEDLLRYKGMNDPLYKKSYNRADLFYGRGRDYGLNSLWRGKRLEEVLVLSQDEFEKELKGFGKGSLSSLFWTAFCWGSWINLHRDEPAAFVELPRVTAIMKRVLELDPSFYYGSAHSFVASVAATRPKLLGGDPMLAKEEFLFAMEASPDYLMHKVLFAQHYAVQVQDVDLFRKELEEVLGAAESGDPAKRLANELARRKAKLLLERLNNFF